VLDRHSEDTLEFIRTKEPFALSLAGGRSALYKATSRTIARLSFSHASFRFILFPFPYNFMHSNACALLALNLFYFTLQRNK